MNFSLPRCPLEVIQNFIFDLDDLSHFFIAEGSFLFAKVDNLLNSGDYFLSFVLTFHFCEGDWSDGC